MNYEIQTQIPQLATQKKQLIVQILDQLCQQLELTDTQYQTIKNRYQTISEWIVRAESTHLQQSKIYIQGSIALGTTIKPYGRNEYDGDLVCLLPTLTNMSNPSTIKALIGNRLKEHDKYNSMIEEKRRCWRINYANEFHLDITPSVFNLDCRYGGELVPDKSLFLWKPTNPKGYIARFEYYSKLQPKFHPLTKLFAKNQANIQLFPEQTLSKPILKRIVQLLKCHRDRTFATPTCSNLAPISIILTTLAAWSYAYCVTHNVYTETFDLIIDVIRRMPDFISIEERNGQMFYIIENETTTNENFADKWNKNSQLAVAFFNWHKKALASFESLYNIEGTNRLVKHLQDYYGATLEQAKHAFAPFNFAINKSRSEGTLSVVPSFGITAAPSIIGAVNVKPNTFFGR